MKTIILAGGFGTRFSEYTEAVPKPLIKIGDYPIIWHIMNWYARHGYKDFLIALGYKKQLIKEYFLNYQVLNSDFTVNLKTGDLKVINNSNLDWNVTLCDTGLNTMTGGRVRALKNIIGKNRFMLTYGDGLSNVDVNDLIQFHKSHKKLVTMTAVRPTARFGELTLNDNKVLAFREKPQLSGGWINGGFFVCEPEFIEFIDSDDTLLEREPLERAAQEGQLMAYKHENFWQCMDTKRDHDLLTNLWEQGIAPWK